MVCQHSLGMGYARVTWLLLLAGFGLLSATSAAESQEHEARPGGSSRTIPFEMNGDHIVIEVAVHGGKLDLTLDTGNVMAPTILYGSPKIDALGLDYGGEARVGGAGDGPMAHARVAPSVTVGLAGIDIPDQQVVVMAHDPRLLAAFEGEDGVIGGTVWSRFVARIDFERKVIVLTEPDGFVYRGSGRELSLGSLPDGGSTVTGAMTLLDGKEIPMQFHLDLGSPVALSINVGSRPEITLPDKTIERVAFGGQGEFIEHVGRVRSIRLGDLVLEGVLASFTGTPSLARMGNEGAIGSGVLQRFHVTFDYANRRLFLEPNEHFQDPFEFDMSGLGLRKTEEGTYTIVRIVPDSPASEAGLTVGDVLLGIDGRSSDSIDRDEMGRMLKVEGARVSLEVVRDAQPKIVSIRLRRLV